MVKEVKSQVTGFSFRRKSTGCSKIIPVISAAHPIFGSILFIHLLISFCLFIYLFICTCYLQIDINDSQILNWCSGGK